MFKSMKRIIKWAGKYKGPDELVRSMSCAFASWDAAQ